MTNFRNSDDLSRVLGDNLNRIRTEKDMTLDDVAKGAGITKQMVSYVENGQHVFSLKTLVKVARVVGVSPSELLEGL